MTREEFKDVLLELEELLHADNTLKEALHIIIEEFDK